MPPRPISRLIVYRSASATWSRPGRPLIQRKDTVGVGPQRAYGRGARPGLLILRPRLDRQHVTTPDPLPDDSWAVDERSLKAFADKLRRNAKAGELVLPGFGGVANDRLRRDLSRGGNIAFWLRPSQ